MQPTSRPKTATVRAPEVALLTAPVADTAPTPYGKMMSMRAPVALSVQSEETGGGEKSADILFNVSATSASSTITATSTATSTAATSTTK